MIEVYDCSNACVGTFKDIKDFVEKYYYTQDQYEDFIRDSEISYPLSYDEEIDNYVNLINKEIVYADYPVAKFDGFEFIFKEEE